MVGVCASFLKTKDKANMSKKIVGLTALAITIIAAGALAVLFVSRRSAAIAPPENSPNDLPGDESSVTIAALGDDPSGELSFQPAATNLLPPRTAHQEEQPTEDGGNVPDTDLLFAELMSDNPGAARRALAALFGQKRNLADADLIKFWSNLRLLSADASSPDRLRIDAIWSLAAVGLLAKERNLLAAADIEQECAFLCDLAAKESAEHALRSVALKAIGALRITDGIPVLKDILMEADSWNQPEIARAATLSMSTLAPSQAVAIVGNVLSGTTNSAVAGTAAYALGQTGDPSVLPALVANRSRLGDNLSVDNAIQTLSTNILAVLNDAASPYLPAAIEATKGLWTAEQKAAYVPRLIRILSDPEVPIPTKKVAATRLLDHAAHLHPDEEQKLLRAILPTLRQQNDLASETAEADRREQGSRLEPVQIIRRNPEENP